jgi:hypothetical protein
MPAALFCVRIVVVDVGWVRLNLNPHPLKNKKGAAPKIRRVGNETAGGAFVSAERIGKPVPSRRTPHGAGLIRVSLMLID